MALDFQNYLYSSSPPDFELFTPLYLGKRRRSPPKVGTRKFTGYKQDDGYLHESFRQLQLDDTDVNDSLYDDYGVDIVGLTKCTDRLCLCCHLEAYAAFHWARKLVITSFRVGNCVPRNS